VGRCDGVLVECVILVDDLLEHADGFFGFALGGEEAGGEAFEGGAPGLALEAFVQMRRYFLQNATLFQKIEQVETRQLKHIADSDEKFNRLFNALDDPSKKTPDQGIFFNGQIFDAYAFASNLIREAKKEIVLIDNYIDDSVLTLLSKRNAKVAATLYTRKIHKTLLLDLEKHNAQYPKITLKTLAGFHDRFLIIDAKALYHLGASLKDLGKQCFAFSRMDDLLPEILDKLK